MSPCSVPTAGVHGAVMSIDDGAETAAAPGSPGPRCTCGEGGGCPPRGGAVSLPGYGLAQAGAFRLAGAGAGKGLPAPSIVCGSGIVSLLWLPAGQTPGRRTPADSLLSTGARWPRRASACSERRREAAIIFKSPSESKRLCASPLEGWRQRWGCSCTPPLPTSQGWGGPSRGTADTA